MVYRGRPSTGCKKCRQRKIKCDERPEGCVKCADKGFQCPGYENSLDRLFQDESASVQIKADKAKAKAIIARDKRDEAIRARNAFNKMQDAMGIPLLCPLIDQGIAFFMHNIAAGLEQPPMQSEAYSNHLSTYGFHPILATTMTALGLTGVANIYMDGGLKREAMKWYLNALKMTNKALANPADVKSDNTLLATMLLSVFEATSNDKSLIGWANHVAGSASLLRMRGTNQFATPAGRRMFMQTVGLLTMNCMGMGSALPDYVHELNKEVVKWEDKSDPGNRFYHLHIAAIDFRAHILNGEFTSLSAILERALEIDAGASIIFDNVGDADDWAYEVEYCDEGTPGVSGTYYHIYPHLAGAQTRNWVRYNRIYLHDIIRNTLIAGFATHPPTFGGMKYLQLLEESTQTLYQLQADILASIPQYLHDTPKVPMSYSSRHTYTFTYAPTSTREGLVPASTGNTPTPSSPPTSYTPSLVTPPSSPKLLTSNFLFTTPGNPKWVLPATPRERLPIIRVSGGYSSLWALYVAGATQVATHKSQNFVLDSLERVSSEFGINQARVLARALRLKIEIDRKTGGLGMQGDAKAPWSHIVPAYIPKEGPHVQE